MFFMLCEMFGFDNDIDFLDDEFSLYHDWLIIGYYVDDDENQWLSLIEEN